MHPERHALMRFAAHEVVHALHQCSQIRFGAEHISDDLGRDCKNGVAIEGGVSDRDVMIATHARTLAGDAQLMALPPTRAPR